MTHHTAAYFETTGAAVTNSQINALTDGILTIRNNNFFLIRPMDLLFAAIFGADLSAARIDSPTIRDIARPQIAPLGDAVIPGTEPRVQSLLRAPIEIPADEEVSLEVSEGSVGGSNITGIIGLRTEDRPIPVGRVSTILATSTATATANQWTDLGALSFENSLRAGKYAVIGMEAYSANMIAARINFESVDGQKPRPGCVGAGAQDEQTHEMFRFGRLGVWGEFDNVILPTVEVLCNAGDTSFRFLFDIVKTQ